MEIKGGCTLWARQTIESEIFLGKPDKWFKIWFYLISAVNHRKSGRYTRGSALIPYKHIITACNASKHQVDKLIRWAKRVDMLTTRKTTRGMVVTILNYNKYQDLNMYRVDSRSTAQSTAGRNTDDTINKNDNNERKKTTTVFSYPSWLNQKLWAEYKKHRIKKRSPMTKYAEKLAINKLLKLTKDGFSQEKIINNVIEKGWSGIYAPKDNGNKPQAEAAPRLKSIDEVVKERGF